MSEVTINVCDGPTCANQRDKPAFGTERDRWIMMFDGSPDDGMAKLHFCSWVCVGRYAEAKAAHL